MEEHMEPVVKFFQDRIGITPNNDASSLLTDLPAHIPLNIKE